MAAAVRHARSLDALNDVVGPEAARELGTELGRLRSGIAAVATIDRERTDELGIELDGLAERVGRLEAIVGELYLGNRPED